MKADSWLWVDSASKVREAVEDMDQSLLIALDTEYDSLHYFREKLCLVQIRAAKRTYVFDPLNGIDLAFLRPYLADPRLLKITHAGDNDIRILKRDYNFEFNNLFDTQRAAHILGCRYLALSHIVERYLGVEIEKTKKMQRSKWELRPLSEGQLEYAVQDTVYLADLYRQLDERLCQRGMKDQARKVFEEMTAVSWREKTLDSLGHRKIKGYDTLTRDQQERLKRLYRWRFKKAKQTNRAMFLILSDQELLSLSKGKWQSDEELQSANILSSEKTNLYGCELGKTLSAAC
ncbi:ribonuclease D [Syntrophus gentianae]|uniref:Ribonuclease D n=1 Tax=Syntrophus gentianae TaxID=43775 RepID=A0A1H7V814_9BACT|nr:ribonuclease D [Syntrophus gentianae]SEM05154.1 ribonuclease D [Syntrophus gentianae]